MLETLNTAVTFLREQSSLLPTTGVILGSGLGALANAVDADLTVPYSDIPGAKSSTVVGHSGKLILGRLAGSPLVVMQGRVHYYEGYSMEEVLFLPRVMGRLGIKQIIVTNAAGGLNRKFSIGDLMLLTDHINFFGVNPLRGPNVDELGARFPDMTEVYPEGLRKTAKKVAKEKGIPLQEGVYMGLPGPTYETPAEIRAYRKLGADAVGMSTVPEVIALAHMSIPALGISCITNMAAGMLKQKLHHGEVIETTKRIEKEFASLVTGIVKALGSK